MVPNVTSNSLWSIIQLFLGYFFPVPDTVNPHAHIINANPDYEVISKSYYHFQYSEEHEQPLWVFYVLTPEVISGPAKRQDRFAPDPEVKTESAQLSDYKDSGYDRGHLCPSVAIKITQEANDETFYMSNISPQVPQFNRQKWKELEARVRNLVNVHELLLVTTGPILDTIIDKIGENEVSVPGSYYKVLFAPPDRMIGYIMPNKKLEKPISAYMVPVDSIEKRTNLDFFWLLDDSTETALELGKFMTH